MESTKCINVYNQVDEEEEFRRNSRKRLIIITISAILLTILVVGFVAGILTNKKNSNAPAQSAASTALKSMCSVTRYPKSCFTSLDSSNNSTQPENILRLSLTVASDSLKKASAFPANFMNSTVGAGPMEEEALNVCGEVLNDAVYSLHDSISSLNGGKLADVRTWLSTAVTDIETCFDALEEANATFIHEFRFLMENSTEFTSNSLAIASWISRDFKIPTRRRLAAIDFPAWIEVDDWRMMEEVAPKADVTVAADGSGDVTTIKEAVAMIPVKSEKRFVIHVVAGEYTEYIQLNKSQWNVMMYGDGMNATIIFGSKNFVDGTPTFKTATFAVAGKGFIARDIGFRNSAGPEKHQAVAFLSTADQSALYRCWFDGFQDTLYAHSNRQFYRDCNISGTIDFIFGNSAVVLQNCSISPKQPLPKQFVTITAQGKTDPNQNTGISIQRCKMDPFDSLNASAYLGRPWKDYATTVVLESDIGGFLDPRGWSPWDPNVDPPKSIFYAEYGNKGPGSDITGRVTWPGYQTKVTPVQVGMFNVEPFIDGSSWLPQTSVEFDLN